MKKGLIFLTSLLLIILPFRLESAITPERDVLNNGLTVIHLERHELPLVMVTVVVKAGSKNEPGEMAGLANFVGEMITEGTQRYTSQDLSEELDYIGASLDVEVDYDYTLIKLSILKKDMIRGFEILYDILRNATFPEKEINRKREMLITSIMKSEEEPMTFALRKLRKMVFKGHPYGRAVEGEPGTLRKIKRHDLMRFYRENYRPERTLAVIAGDVSSGELTEMINRYFINWKPGNVEGLFQIFDGSSSSSDTGSEEKDVFIERNVTQSSIAIGVIGLSRKDKDYYSLTVMNYILGGGGFASRLMQRIREKEGLAYDVSSYHTVNVDPGIFVVQVQTKNESRESVLKMVMEEIDRIRTYGITDEELKEAKAYLKGSFHRRLDTTRRLADFYGVVEFFGLGDDYIKRYTEYIDSVTKEEVKEIAGKIFSNALFTVVVGKR